MITQDAWSAINGAIGVAVAAFVTWLTTHIYKRYIRDRAFPAKVDKLIERADKSDEIHMVLIRSQKSQTKILKTVLEVVAKNMNNGNVEDAFGTVAEADKEMDEFLLKHAVSKQGVSR